MDATGSILPGFRLTDVGRDVFIKSDVDARSSIFADVPEGFAFLQTFDFGFGLQALDFGTSALSFNPAGEINLHRGNRAGARAIGFDGRQDLAPVLCPPSSARFGRRVGRARAGQQLRPQFAG